VFQGLPRFSRSSAEQNLKNKKQGRPGNEANLTALLFNLPSYVNLIACVFPAERQAGWYEIDNLCLPEHVDLNFLSTCQSSLPSLWCNSMYMKVGMIESTARFIRLPQTRPITYQEVNEAIQCTVSVLKETNSTL